MDRQSLRQRISTSKVRPGVAETKFRECNFSHPRMSKFASTCKYNQKQKYKKQKVYEPHSGGLMELPDITSYLLQIGIATGNVHIENHLENLALLVFNVSQQTSPQGVFGVFLAYFKSIYSKSLVVQAKGALESLMGSDGCGLVPHGGEDPQWMECIRNFRHNWKGIVGSEAFSKLSNLLSLTVVLGLCDAKSLTFTLGGFELFTPYALGRHKTAFDLVDAAVETVLYFVEGGYRCFQSGSIKPFFYRDHDIVQFEEDCSFLLTHLDYVRNGNLGRVGMDENDYAAKLDKTIEQADTLLGIATRDLERQLVRRKLEDLRRCRATFNQIRTSGGLREAPYSTLVYGATGVGKSTVAEYIMHTVLTANGYSNDKTRIINMNESDKYFSNMRSDVNGIYIDDACNTRAEHVERPVSKSIIDFVNNVKQTAVMAEADQKGKVSIEPKSVVLTTNVKDIESGIFSNCPESILRRFHSHITVRPKPEFTRDSMLCPTLIRRHYEERGIPPPKIEDLWEIDVEYVVPTKREPTRSDKKKVHIAYQPHFFAGKALRGASMSEVLQFLVHHSQEHFADQAAVVAKSNATEFVVCAQCKHHVELCRCPKSFDGDSDDPDPPDMDQEVEPHFGEAFFNKLNNIADDMRYKAIVDAKRVGANLDDWALEKLVSAYDEYSRSIFNMWPLLVPVEMFKSELFQRLFMAYHKPQIDAEIEFSHRNFNLLMVLCVLSTYTTGGLSLILLAYFYFRKCVAAERVKKRLLDEIYERRTAFSVALRGVKERNTRHILKGCLVLTGIYAMACAYKAVRRMQAQGNLAPTTPEEVVQRDQEVNQWAQAIKKPLPRATCRTVTHDQLSCLVKGNLTHFSYAKENGGRGFCNALFISSNVCIIPQHMWIKDELLADFVRHSPDAVGGNFSCHISKRHSVQLCDDNGKPTDLSLVWVPNGGDWKDLTKYFPETIIQSSVPAKGFWKSHLGGIEQLFALLDPKTIHNGVMTVPGFEYNLSVPTRTGMCMATFVSQTHIPLIAGFHIGGVTNTPHGVAAAVGKKSIDKALLTLREIPCVLLAKSEGTLETQRYGIEYADNSEPVSKSAINFMPHGTNVINYGHCIGGARYVTECEPTIMSNSVEREFGVPNQWDGPKFKPDWRPWQVSLTHSARPSVGVSPSLLERAYQDYLGNMIRVFQLNCVDATKIRPLDRMQTLCGIDGLKFIDKMNPKTSRGFPLAGAKEQDITYLVPTPESTHQCPAELDPMYYEEVDKAIAAYRRGERAYFLFKACLKDEPTRTTKDKVRVFQAADMVCQLLTRKYFLPLCRILSIFPLRSECAVGINAHSKEWEQLHHHVTKYGVDRILAGDYGKYDLRMPAQLMLAAFRLLIELAKMCSYTEDDICVMEGIATDICYNMVAYNGVLIKHIGSNPSGQNLTVYINSIVNSLLFRCAFFETYPQARSFTQACSMITYGDDVKSSVHEKYDSFNFFTVQDFLARHDIVFTMPDKESEPTKYMHDADADFLKRKTVYIPELGYHVGALDQASMFKALHCCVRSHAVSREEQAMGCVTSVLHEVYAHGREVYEEWRARLQRVCDDCQISHGVPTLNKNFDELVEEKRDKYNPEGLSA